MIVYDVATKELDSEIFPQHIITDLNLWHYIYCFVQSGKAFTVKGNKHTHASAKFQTCRCLHIGPCVAILTLLLLIFSWDYILMHQLKCQQEMLRTWTNAWDKLYMLALAIWSTCRSSPPEVFLKKGVLKICSKFTGNHSCWSVISVKLQSNFIDGLVTDNLLSLTVSFYYSKLSKYM